ncbi:MAG TPA: hypothetical protein VNO20_09930 [Solirubrobacterales bacterium]|nr:hypothetical protein [Solirubrobacterales bacterium]
MEVGNRPWLLRGAVIGLALVVGVVAWLGTKDDDETPASTTEAAEVRIVSEEELAGLGADAGQAVYWAGPVGGTELEVTNLAEQGGVQIRYLEEGAEAGSGGADVLTVGSYPLPDPAGAIDGLTAEPGAIVRTSDDGRQVVANAERPTSVYFASPDNSVQVEVYDPDPARALRLALSSQVRPAE